MVLEGIRFGEKILDALVQILESQQGTHALA